MKRIIRLTENDLTRIVRLVMKEGEYPMLIDPSQFEYNGNGYKPFHDLITTKHNFEFLKNENDMNLYIFKKDDWDVIIGTQNSYDIGKALLFIYIVPKKGKTINYIEEVTGKPGLKVLSNEKTKVNRFINGAMEFVI